MFNSSSRYARLPNRLYTAPDGTQTVYKARRLLPQPLRVPARGTVEVKPGDRPDLVAARSLGQPELFWRLADANGATDPFTLTRLPGRRLRVPAAEAPALLPSQESGSNKGSGSSG